MTTSASTENAMDDAAQVWTEMPSPGLVAIRVAGRLDPGTTARVWTEAMAVVEQNRPRRVEVDAAGVEYCDISGIAFFVELGRFQNRTEGELEIRGLRKEFRKLLDFFDPAAFAEVSEKREATKDNLAVRIGQAASRMTRSMAVSVAYVGEVGLTLLRVILYPRTIRWTEVLRAAEKAGVNALPIVTLISFLVGLIMAFQATVPMRQFGAEIFVADLVSLSMLRELGPLMTAIVLTGRSGSSFAAELGTMKVDEEIDALTTMGLEPVRFLVVPRIIAAVAMTPLLAVYAGIIGVCGGSFVLVSLGYSFSTYFREVVGAASYGDFLGGIFKSLVFGFVIAGVGCLRGLETGIGPTAVGDATTRAVVSGIVLIVVIDGIFSVVFYYLGI